MVSYRVQPAACPCCRDCLKGPRALPARDRRRTADSLEDLVADALFPDEAPADCDCDGCTGLDLWLERREQEAGAWARYRAEPGDDDHG